LHGEKQIQEFAALVAAAERDAICPIVYGRCGSDNDAQRIVDAIRARGER
jgi:dienelactone hydrolase